MKKVQAFTLIEITISLFISSIVIGILYYAFLFFSKQYNSYERNSLLFTELSLFKHAIKHDFDNADFVLDSVPDALLFQKKEHKIIYAWNANRIIRIDGQSTDSFTFSKASLVISHLHDSIRLVNQIEFRTQFNRTYIETIFTKQYSASEILQAEKLYNE